MPYKATLGVGLAIVLAHCGPLGWNRSKEVFLQAPMGLWRGSGGRTEFACIGQQLPYNDAEGAAGKTDRSCRARYKAARSRWRKRQISHSRKPAYDDASHTLVILHTCLIESASWRYIYLDRLT